MELRGLATANRSTSAKYWEEVLPQPLFSRGAEVVRDLAHVKVERVVEKGANGAPPITLYRKNFKLDGWNVWSDRENRFLNLFSAWKLRHVVQTHQYRTVTPGVTATVDTHDAGLTIEEWLQIAPCYADGTTFNHPFRRGEDFLRLMRACLVALEEIHLKGVVHGDIKQDNICLPYAPHPHRHGQLLRPDFAAIRLIDFSFSFGRDLPLEQPLPIDPVAAYQSPLLKAALAEDRQSGRPEKTGKLDGRVDLYGLGYMGQQIMAASNFFWDTEERGASGKAAAREMMDDLLALGSGKIVLRYAFSDRHERRLIRKLDKWLRGAKAQEAFVPADQAAASAAAGTPITPVITPLPTPITPLIKPVVVKPVIEAPGQKGRKQSRQNADSDGQDDYILGREGIESSAWRAWARAGKDALAAGMAVVFGWLARIFNWLGDIIIFLIGVGVLFVVLSVAGSALWSFLQTPPDLPPNPSLHEPTIPPVKPPVAQPAPQPPKPPVAQPAPQAPKPALDPDAELKRADALAKRQDRGHAYLLYATLGDTASGQRKQILEARKQAMLEEVVRVRDTAAGPVILSDVGKRATADGGYAYFLGLLNACALPKPDLPAARAAYTLALKDKNLREHAQAALDSKGGWCPGGQ